jgi:hypothetical protein
MSTLNLPAGNQLCVISGGQTGADLGGLLAAESLGIVTTGWAPKGFKTERGPQLLLKSRFRLMEHQSPSYNPRTVDNLKASDVTLIFSPKPDSKGTVLTCKSCVEHGIAHHVYSNLDDAEEAHLLAFLQLMRPRVINVAGNRESVSPKLSKRVRAFLLPALERYQHEWNVYLSPDVFDG